MDIQNKKYDCLRGCTVARSNSGERRCEYSRGCCKLAVHDSLRNITDKKTENLFEVRFKNTRKQIFLNDTGTTLTVGDIVVVETTSGHDVGIITLAGPAIIMQFRRHNIRIEDYEFKKIYRKAKIPDIDKWQDAISREHKVMIRTRQIATSLNLSMKIGDVEFQGDGTKAIFYYIADERVDFRNLIKLLADEFKIRIEMRQIGARQEAALIGGLGVCGMELCCARYISFFQSITTQTARIQDLSLNPQKLAGQCGKLKCCINYESACYQDMIKEFPIVKDPIQTDNGEIYFIKNDILNRSILFCKDPSGYGELIAVSIEEVREILSGDGKLAKISNLGKGGGKETPDFKSAVGEESISRFDDKTKSAKRKGGKRNRKR